MTITKATPYVFFNGTAEKAIALYQSALGAKVEGMQRYTDLPEGVDIYPPAHKSRVMHCFLRIGSAELMCSDRTEDVADADAQAVHVTLDFDDVEEMQRCFDALAKSGKVGMAIHDAFWGDKFGTLTDEFGVRWMFTGRAAKA